MIYGLMAGGDIKLSSICRAYRPTITMKKAGDRLSMHLGAKDIATKLHAHIARKVARRIRSDTLIIVDPSDIQKPYATQMDFLGPSAIAVKTSDADSDFPRRKIHDLELEVLEVA